MTVASEKRVAHRVAFDHELRASVIAIDGTWSVQGRIRDVSETGAKFYAFGRINERMRTEEFFLIVTSDGKVRRRAKIVWERRGLVGVSFVASRLDH